MGRRMEVVTYYWAEGGGANMFFVVGFFFI